MLGCHLCALPHWNMTLSLIHKCLQHSQLPMGSNCIPAGVWEGNIAIHLKPTCDWIIALYLTLGSLTFNPSSVFRRLEFLGSDQTLAWSRWWTQWEGLFAWFIYETVQHWDIKENINFYKSHPASVPAFCLKMKAFTDWMRQRKEEGGFSRIYFYDFTKLGCTVQDDTMI